METKQTGVVEPHQTTDPVTVEFWCKGDGIETRMLICGLQFLGESRKDVANGIGAWCRRHNITVPGEVYVQEWKRTIRVGEKKE